VPFEDRPPRTLQQQPARYSNPQQQRAGATEFQGAGRTGADSDAEGAGSERAAREYRKNIRQYLEQASRAR
jgi:hypothetical protein